MKAPHWDLPNLDAELIDLLCQVPRGRVTTYGRLAEALGATQAARWVGHFLLHSPDAAKVPAHRVVRADGDIGLFGQGSVEEKTDRLLAEGVAVNRDSVDLSQYGFEDFTGPRSLRLLRQQQRRLRNKIVLSPPTFPIRTVAGVDVSYARRGSVVCGTAAYALVDVNDGRLLGHWLFQDEVAFPYISSFLAFRELPLLSAVIQQAADAGSLADVIMVDGSGIMHPHRAGIATHLGIALQTATIGVTKKLLHGKVESPRSMPPRRGSAVRDQDEELGFAIQPSTGSDKPLFVSPGHLIDVETARDVAARLLLRHRLPEPIYWADRLSRQQAQSSCK